MQAAEWGKNRQAHLNFLPGFEHPGLFYFFGTRNLSWEDLKEVAPAVRLKQVHGDRVVRLKEEFSSSPHASRLTPHGILDFGEGDALITNQPGVVLSVSTADCVPLLFFDPGVGAIGAAHAGWRGTVKEIAPRVVESLAKEYGASPKGLRVAIGPRIGPCCYEVGEEVLNQIQPDRFKEVVSRPSRDRRFLDLAAWNRLQLMEVGVPPEAIHVAPLCTSCRPDRFFSYRRDRGRSGNMISGIMLEKAQEAEAARLLFCR